MKPAFPQWARTEIVRLRERADALQQVLDMYLREDAGGEHTPNSESKSASVSSKTRGPRGSKYEAAFVAFERAKRPLTLDDMIEIARNEGFDLDRANMRSLVFTQKRSGRTRPEGNCYIWDLSETSGGKTLEARSEAAGGVPADLASRAA